MGEFTLVAVEHAVVEFLHLKARNRRSVADKAAQHKLCAGNGAIGKTQFNLGEVSPIGFFGFTHPDHFRRVAVGDEAFQAVAFPPVIIVFGYDNAVAALQRFLGIHHLVADRHVEIVGTLVGTCHNQCLVRPRLAPGFRKSVGKVSRRDSLDFRIAAHVQLRRRILFRMGEKVADIRGVADDSAFNVLSDRNFERETDRVETERA